MGYSSHCRRSSGRRARYQAPVRQLRDQRRPVRRAADQCRASIHRESDRRAARPVGFSRRHPEADVRRWSAQGIPRSYPGTRSNGGEGCPVPSVRPPPSRPEVRRAEWGQPRIHRCATRSSAVRLDARDSVAKWQATDAKGDHSARRRRLGQRNSGLDEVHLELAFDPDKGRCCRRDCEGSRVPQGGRGHLSASERHCRHHRQASGEAFRDRPATIDCHAASARTDKRSRRPLLNDHRGRPASAPQPRS